MEELLRVMSAEGMAPEEALLEILQRDPEAAIRTAGLQQAPETPAISLKRAEANRLFKAGDLVGAVTAYEAALNDPSEEN